VQVEALRRQLIEDESAVQENVQLKQALAYKGPPSLANFRRVHASVLTNPQSAIDESITIAAGTGDGVAAGNVVITPQGLVGTVDKAWSDVARVTLLTDGQSAVTARDLTNPAAVGIVKRGGGDVLVFDRVPKSPYVGVGDTVITAGSVGRGALPSMFPRGIQIGTVASQSNNDVNTFKTIQLKPFVDFATLQSVIVLVPRAGEAGG
jgi:rod shape-determining protein MreC